MRESKFHWYDGLFYDKFIAPNQDNLFNKIKDIIKEGSKVVDIGCATGRLEFMLCDKCSNVTGIDLSSRNINRAKRRIQNTNINNITFLLEDVDYLINNINEKFDYAVLTFVIHEVPPDERLILLNKISSISTKIIIGDYLIPQPVGFRMILNEVVEFLAGREHYKGFKNFAARGGIVGLAAEAKMKIVHEEKDIKSANHIVILSN